MTHTVASLFAGFKFRHTSNFELAYAEDTCINYTEKLNLKDTLASKTNPFLRT